VTAPIEADDDAVQRYLDDLFTGLRGQPRACRRLLAETETHLLDALDAGLAEGLSHDEAAERAVARFGPPSTLVGAGLPVTAVVSRMLRPLLLAAAGLAAAGMLAVGASGVIAGVFRATLGDRFVAGDLPGVSYTAARCADFFEYAPSARTCLDAAASHHADEVVVDRIAIGVLGVIALAVYLALRRSWAGSVRVDGGLPAGFAPGIGTALFGLAAAVLSLASFSALLVGRIDGGGQYLSAALVATAAAVAFAVCWLRAVVRPVTLAEPGAQASPEGS
jgi:hypothetical protein